MGGGQLAAKRRVHAAIDVTEEQFNAIKTAALASGVLRSEFYAAAILYVSRLPPEERRTIVAAHIAGGGQQEGE